MEYTIRTDTESVSTDMLQWHFKDANCLHEYCEGWISTMERIRQSRSAHLRRHDDNGNSTTEYGSGQDDDSADILREKLKENKIAWSLAKLNPCLRWHEKKELLGIAVRHLISLRESSIPIPAEAQSESGTPVTNMNDTHVGFIGNPFVIQSPVDIMNDAHLEETSSDEYEDDLSCVSEEVAADSEFPVAFIDAQGIRYMTFDFCLRSISGTQYAGYYTVRADVESIRSSMSRSFLHDECICQDEWKRPQRGRSTHRHHNDCDVALALSRLNPILQGKENEKLRWAAMVHYKFMAILEQQSLTQSDRRKDYGRLLNPVVMYEVVEGGFVLFMRTPEDGTPGAQCRYCNMIVDGMGYRGRATHMARCDGYLRKGEIRMGTDE